MILEFIRNIWDVYNFLESVDYGAVLGWCRIWYYRYGVGRIIPKIKVCIGILRWGAFIRVGIYI